jgi:DNA-binding transcriptional LysR family regulator
MTLPCSSLRGAAEDLRLQTKLLVYFAVLACEGSFDGAADRLGIPKEVLTDQIMRLEKLAGACLLVRSGRHVTPTREGRQLFDECAGILNATSQAFDRLKLAGGGPMGHLRINAPLDYGAAVVAPALAAYARRYPKVRVELHLSAKFVELGGSQFDVALQLGPDGSGLPSRQIGTFDHWLVCSSALASLAAELRRPQDLQALPWVGDVTLSNMTGWRFWNTAEGAYTLNVMPAITVHASAAARTCILAGAGIGVLPDFLASDDLQGGRLVRLLPEWTLPHGDIHAVFSIGRCNSVAAEAMVDMLMAPADTPNVCTG